MADSTISPYNIADLKNTTDDALTNYLTGLKFKQSHGLANIRLLLGYTAVVLAAAAFLADYKLGWDKSKDWTAIAVVVYFLLNGAFTYWIWGVEKGLIFEGVRAGKKIRIFTKTKKFDPTYYITVVSPSGESTELQAPFPTWFTADGYFVAKPFQQWLASSVPTVGDVDLKNAARDERDELAAPGPVHEVILEERTNGSVAASATSGGISGGSKRSKRKG